nr:hypothetical protein CFP56_35509 [Quercus suber]
MGLALCGLFHFTKHPTAVRKNFDLRTFDLSEFQCFLQTSSCPRRLVCFGLLSECNELISLVQRAFIWVLFIPYTAHSHLWSQSTWFNFSFHSYSPDLSVESCGINLVYRQNMEELTRIMARYASSSPFDRTFLDNTRDPKTVYHAWDNFPEIFIEASSSSEYLHPQSLFISPGETSGTAQYSYEDDPYPDNQFRYFNLSTLYNFCFPTRRTLKWFNHQSRGHSISIDITSNLYDDSNWMGSASLDQIHFCRIDSEEKNWLSFQYEFSWISYIPGEAFKDMLNQCEHIKASFVSDLPGVIVQKCGLHLLHKHDELQFERELQYCYTLISPYEDFNRWVLKQENETTQHEVKVKNIKIPEIKQLDLDGCFEYFGCFPLVNILPSFSSQSNEPSVTIYVPKYFYNDIDWMGLVLCANFSIQEHQTAILENPNSTVSHHLICLLETDVAGTKHLLVHHTNYEELVWLDTEGQFLWLSCISRELLPDEFNQCDCIKASIISDWPGVMVQKCGLSFFHVNDDWFKEKRYLCKKQYISQNLIYQMMAGKLKMKQDHDDETGPRRTSSSNEDRIHHEIIRRPVDKGETSEAKDQHCQSNLLDFDLRLVHNFCFPKYEDRGGFFWMSYIPRGSLPDWLNHCIHAKFSFATNCPGLKAQKCGLLPLYKHTGQKCGHGSSHKLCEREFKAILMRHVESLSANWNIIWRLTIDDTNRRRQKHDNEATPSTSGSSNEDSHPERQTEHVDPMLKDKGKRVLE